MKPLPGHDPRPALWTTGACFTGAGLLITIMDNPIVPLPHVFHLLPIGLGGALGAAILREKLGPRWTEAYVVLMFWLLTAVFQAQTTGGLILLAAGIYSLGRAIVRTALEMEA